MSGGSAEVHVEKKPIDELQEHIFTAIELDYGAIVKKIIEDKRSDHLLKHSRDFSDGVNKVTS